MRVTVKMGWVSAALIGACAPTVIAGLPSASAASSWTVVADPGAPTLDQTETLLPNGRVLVTGGEVSTSGTSRADLFDVATSTWVGAAPMGHLRDQSTATLLADGTVLVAGGTSSSTQAKPVGPAEVYDPSSNTWSTVGRMRTPRFDAMAVSLASGKVLICGGTQNVSVNLSGCEIYDPSTKQFQGTGAMHHRRRYSSMITLKSGDVLAVGDYVRPEIYSVSKGTWSFGARSPHYSGAGTLTLLRNGDVLSTPSYYSGPAPTQIFHPSTDTWTTSGSLDARIYNATVTLPNGNLLTMGGCSRGCSTQNLTTADYYDVATGKWSAAPSMNLGREDDQAVVLPDGRVLVVGGGAAPEIFS